MNKPCSRPLASLFWFLPVAWLWLVLVNGLRVEWTVNPQYSYGWAVPFLCAFLIWQRVRTPGSGLPKADGRRSSIADLCHPLLLFSAFGLLAFLYAPTRLVEEANPGWRLVSWALAIETVGLTLLSLWLWQRAHQRFNLSAFVFPVCYFLVAVPWPTPVEAPLIQGLTRLDTGVTTELLGWLGIPAMPHGNVIEVATGMVGIDEACSGIRSFQATLMLSLFLGELYGLNPLRRGFCVLAGFALSFLFNLARMLLLVWVAARKGIAAIASWHDPAGTTILVACFFCLWGLGAALRCKRQTAEGETANGIAEGGNSRQTNAGEWGNVKEKSRKPLPLSAFRISALALGGWILLTELSVEAWYHTHEARLPAAIEWTVAWPTNAPSFKELPLAGTTRQILRYDEGRSAAWETGGLKWQAVFLRWRPGRTAIHLAQNHTPEICLTGVGYTLKSLSPQEWFDVNGLRLPFLAYQVTDAPQPFYVFYCLWDDRAGTQGFQTMGLTYGNRLAPVLAGLRNPGQRSLEIAVSGPASAAAAEAALAAELKQLVVPKP